MDNINWQYITITIAVASLLIGLIRLWVSYRQHQTFKHNISPGVRTRQQDMIRVILDTIGKVNRETYLSLDELQSFRKTTKDHHLLFDSDQCRYIRELDRQLQVLHKISVPLQTKTLTKDKWDEYSRKHMKILHWFDGQEEYAAEQFHEYMEQEARS